MTTTRTMVGSRHPDRTTANRARIVVAGAGSIGCYVGGSIAAAGGDVALLARPAVAATLAARGLTLTDRDGGAQRVAPTAFAVSAEPAVLAEADIVLVTVKSGSTHEMAATIARHAPPSAAVVSLQNGVDNARLLAAALPGRTVVAGMVPFNVVALGDGRFHRATTGRIVVDAAAAGLAARLATPRLPIDTHADMRAVAWGKLLLNLNNALNALSGVPLREELGQRGWRRLLAACMDEALDALDAAGIVPVRLGPVLPRRVPTVLRLPDALFRIVAAAQLRIDPTASSSMADDLAARRRTEIDQLQGAVVALAERHGLAAPTNAAVAARVRAAESKATGSPRLRPADVVAP